jgi:hypothetical protein
MIRLLAYIDPGTGSFALQAAIGTIMGVSFIVRGRIKQFVTRFKKEPRAEEPDEK